MPRFCPHCGRPKTPEFHDRSEAPDHFPVDGNRPGARARRSWVCRVRRLVDQTAGILGTDERKVVRTFVPSADNPEHQQRRTKGAKANNLRTVPEALLKLRENG